MSKVRRHPLCLLTAAVACMALSYVPVRATQAAQAEVMGPVPVRVDRVRPRKEKLATLRFLKTNRDFLRSRLDLLRETPLEQHTSALDIDPRFLAYRDLVAAARASGDSVAVAADADQRRELFASITDLGALESQLDLMERLLADQRTRLTVLQEDFAGHQRSALAIVVSGAPRDGAPAVISITRDDGTSITMPLSPGEQASLIQGGVLELSHGLIEPREQVLEIAFGGGLWAGAPHGFVTLSPARDHLTFLRLDLEGVSADSGASGVLATTWRHDDGALESASRP